MVSRRGPAQSKWGAALGAVGDGLGQMGAISQREKMETQRQANFDRLRDENASNRQEDKALAAKNRTEDQGLAASREDTRKSEWNTSREDKENRLDMKQMTEYQAEASKIISDVEKLRIKISEDGDESGTLKSKIERLEERFGIVVGSGKRIWENNPYLQKRGEWKDEELPGLGEPAEPEKPGKPGKPEDPKKPLPEKTDEELTAEFMSKEKWWLITEIPVEARRKMTTSMWSERSEKVKSERSDNKKSEALKKEQAVSEFNTIYQGLSEEDKKAWKQVNLKYLTTEQRKSILN